MPATCSKSVSVVREDGRPLASNPSEGRVKMGLHIQVVALRGTIPNVRLVRTLPFTEYECSTHVCQKTPLACLERVTVNTRQLGLQKIDEVQSQTDRGTIRPEHCKVRVTGILCKLLLLSHTAPLCSAAQKCPPKELDSFARE